MTTRERKEHRIEQRLAWAKSREQKAETASERAQTIAHGIPFGQPILVGHHSEKHHRADIKRMDSAMRQSLESSSMAEQHRQRADGIERQLETTIFSDDPDATEAIDAKVHAIRAEVDHCKVVNAAYRKLQGEPVQRLKDLLRSGIIADGEDMELARMFAVCPYNRQPYPGYHMTNLNANARRLEARKVQIQARKVRQEQAEKQGGVSIQRNTANWCVVTFAEKPDRSVLDALRAAGYRWGSGSWQGPFDKLPKEIEA